MVRARSGILEEEDPLSARAKLKDAVEEFVTDERERRLVEPRLAHLLGLEQRAAADRADLFSGWRLFFERVSDDAPVVLAFEDLQWADSGLLEFIDYLLEWSADRPLLVLGLGRSELLARRPAWETIRLGSLSDEAMREALEGLVPGLPEELMGRILRRAEGVPLYAVETVRMLLDRGLLAQEGARYVLTGDVGELDVPETLHALAAARLDGLSADERAVLQDAAVYGQSFTPAGVAALGSRSVAEVQRILDGLVVKQIVGLDDDPRSAERGQYYFLQALLRTTAYGTLSRRDRKERHLAVARHLQEAWGDSAPELAEVLAAHLLDAAEADPDAADAGQIRAMACDTLAEAGRRALSLALGPEAQRAFDRAAELAEDDASRAALLDHAGRAAGHAGSFVAGRERLERAIALFESLGDREAAARSVAVLATALRREDRLEEAIELNRRAVAGLADGSEDKAAALAELSTNLAFSGATEEASEAADAALMIAEPLEEWRTICEAFLTISYVRQKQGRLQEAIAVRERCLSLALEHDVPETALRAYNNLADLQLQRDRFDEAMAIAEEGLALAQSRGDRPWEQVLTLMITTVRVARGEWDAMPEVDSDGLPIAPPLMRRAYLPLLARVHAARADSAGLQRILRRAEAEDESTNVEYAAGPSVARAIALNAAGRHADAIALALPIATSEYVANEDRREAYAEAGRAALALGDEDALERLVAFVAGLPPATRSPLLRAGAARVAGLLAWRRGNADAADERLAAAAREFRDTGARYSLAQVLLEHAEVLSASGREDEAEPLLSEANAIFAALGAAPWLERCESLTVKVSA
jgi:tetratricopeptide (TPR) repeat protein